MTFDNLVHQINELAETQRDRGTYFEYLARAYLQNEPTYQYVEVGQKLMNLHLNYEAVPVYDRVEIHHSLIQVTK